MFGIIVAGVIGVVVGAVAIGGWMAGEDENRQWETESLSNSVEFWRKAYREARDNSYSLEESLQSKIKENELLQQDVTVANDYAASLEEDLAMALVHIIELELNPLITVVNPPFETFPAEATQCNQAPDPKADVKPKAKKVKKAKK